MKIVNVHQNPIPQALYPYLSVPAFFVDFAAPIKQSPSATLALEFLEHVSNP